jgi:transcriptional regulator with XRE-family HTH domain
MTYGAVAGQVVLQHRKTRNVDQSQLAAALGITQSSYSKIEQGQTTMTIVQLRIISEQLGLKPHVLIRQIDDLALKLRSQAVTITDEKAISPAAVLIGLGILAAILSGSK